MSIFFHDFELDLERYLLLERDRPVRLRPKAFDLLAHLVQNRERVVRRAELVDAVWGHTSVGPGSLSGLVNELRSALGEVAGSESSIRTVHARGYQFIASVRGGDARARREAPEDPAVAPRRGSAPAAFRGRLTANQGLPASVVARRKAAIRRALLDTLRPYGIADGDPAVGLIDPLCEVVAAREPMRPMRRVRPDAEGASSRRGGAAR